MPNPLTFSNSAPAYFEDKASDWVPESGKLARHSADVIVYPSNDSAWDSIMYKYDFHARLVRYQQPGYYNDPGFLIPDHPSLSQNKKKTPLCALGFHRRDRAFDILPRSLDNGCRLLTVLNRGADAATTTVSLARLGLSSQSGCLELDSHVAKVYRIALQKSCIKTTPTGMVFNTPSSLCMTASTDFVIFEKCSVSQSQVWHVTATGDASKLTLGSLSDASVCLAAGDGVSLANCLGGTGITRDHYSSGHFRSLSGSCLVQSKNKASIEDCD
ncbi:Glycoside hydrolase family 27 [Penicillium solitum]|uniref:Glycoside hydrolase family 27 n=1 Tax=Penicillium solitum TaxID=60172 RepID=UPI0032C3EC05|nr:Glycoside hydrolase family 27 [Penicillium solitum]